LLPNAQQDNSLCLAEVQVLVGWCLNVCDFYHRLL
jgi:hypothetical protein